MPKPVLSDSLFNANDVATAVLDFAELSVTNQDFAVTDISSSFTKNSNFVYESGTALNAFSFNGFVFLSFVMYTSTSVSTDDTIMTITESNYFPDRTYVTNSVSFEGDTVNFVTINTDGSMKIKHPHNAGVSSFSICINCHYRT